MQYSIIHLHLRSEIWGWLMLFQKTGLYGNTPDEVVITLLEQKLRDEIRSGILEQRPSIVLDKITPEPRCPHCGSPSIEPSGTMGSDLRCCDCGRTFMEAQAIV